MDYTVEITSYDEGMGELHKFEFPVRIIDPTGESNDPDYPEICASPEEAQLRLDWICHEIHGERHVAVQISGKPKTMAQIIRENGGAI